MKPTRLSLHTFIALAMALLLAACAGMQKPVSAEDYLQNAKAQIGATYKTIGDLKAQGSITQAQGKAAFIQVDAIETQVTTAEKVLRGGGDPKTVQGTLQLALTGLLAIEAQLKPKPKP